MKSQGNHYLCCMGNRHNFIIWTFLIAGGILLLSPILYVVIMGIGAGIGLITESRDGYKAGEIRLTENYVLKDEVDGYTVYLRFGLLPDKAVWSEGIDSVWVNEDALALSNQQSYFLGLPSGGFRIFSGHSEFLKEASMHYPDLRLRPAGPVLDSLQSRQLLEAR